MFTSTPLVKLCVRIAFQNVATVLPICPMSGDPKWRKISSFFIILKVHYFALMSKIRLKESDKSQPGYFIQPFLCDQSVRNGMVLEATFPAIATLKQLN